MTDIPEESPSLSTRAVEEPEERAAQHRSDDQLAALNADPALPRPEAPTEAPMLHRAPKRSPFGALLSRTLPAYSGPYQVGVCDVELPVEPRTFGTFRNRGLGIDDRGGLLMQTVLFSLFYPADVAGRPPAPVYWFPSLRQTIDGFLKMANRTPNFFYRMFAYPTAAAAIWGTTFPAHKDPPLLIPPNGHKWPLVLFSHGVGCSRLMYSAFCGELASRGYIVATLEHRDGTSPSSLVTSSDGTVKRIDWLQWSDLSWPDLAEQPKNDTTLRHEQIKMRVAELVEVVQGMRRLSEGTPLQNPVFDDRWRNIDASVPIMAGHSLGGAAALALAASKEIPLKNVIAFDPAVQRLAPWKGELPHPLLVVNSEEFAVHKEWIIFAEQIAGTIKAKRPEVFTIAGATHPAFSDVFLILPKSITRMTGMQAHADEVIARVVNATLDFLRDGHAEAVRRRARKYDKPEAPTVPVKGPAVEEAKEEAEERKKRLEDALEATIAVDALVDRPGGLTLKHAATSVTQPARKGEVELPTRKVGDGARAELLWHDFGE